MGLSAPPGPGEVGVWLVALDAAPPPPSGALGTDEQDALERILDPRRRARAAAGRWARRRILAALTGAEPARLRFAAGPHGKPQLDDPAAPLRFSLSHTGGLLLVAVASAREVGVDGEYVRRRRDPVRLAQVALPAEQAARIATAPEETREVLFHRLWVRHEARVKCHGVGLGTPLPAGARDVVADLALGPGLAGALAAAGEAPFAVVVHDDA